MLFLNIFQIFPFTAGSLPESLKHLISNAEYYGPSLFLLATDLVTAYVFGEPSLLSSLQVLLLLLIILLLGIIIWGAFATLLPPGIVIIINNVIIRY